MLIPTLITLSTAFFIGVLSSAKEKLFLALVFIGLPALGFSMKFIDGIRSPFHTPDGANHLERMKDLFFQVPEEYRLGVYLCVPAFICGRILTWAYVSTRKEKVLSPDQIRAKKNKILKSYSNYNL